ncbi:MAG: TasA family protein [Anaeromassilibacillus sp.]
MQKTKKSRAILSGISVLLVLCLLAGGTMAWFTDTEKVNTNFTAGILDISVKPGEAASTDLTFDNLRPMQLKNFNAELAGNGSDKWTNDVTQNTTSSDYKSLSRYSLSRCHHKRRHPARMQISWNWAKAVQTRAGSDEDGFTITQGKTKACDNGLKEALKVFVYYNENDLNEGGWTQVADVNLNTDYNPAEGGVADEANDTYTTVMIPAGESVRYVIAGYLPKDADNAYQGQHYHGKLVLNAYQMDTTDGGDPDDIVINEVNKDLLQDLYDKLSILLPLEGNFLPDTWQDFVNAMNQAKDVLDNADATADEIANAFEKLMDSSVNLVMEQSPDENLAYIIEKAESIVPAVDAGQYEEAGIEEFRAALARAKEVQADPSASYSDIQEATYNLNEAMMNLRLKDNTNGITTFAANTADPMDVQVALFLTQYVAERDNLNAVDTAEAFFGFLG